MRATGIVHKMDSSGRVVIPETLREYFNLEPGQPLEFFYDNGGITIKKFVRLELEDTIEEVPYESILERKLDKIIELLEQHVN